MAQRPNTLRPELGGWHLWGAQLRALREGSPFRSCSALARAVNCDPSLISKYENATRRPHVDQVRLLDSALDAAGALVDLHAKLLVDEVGSPTAPEGGDDYLERYVRDLVAAHVDEVTRKGPSLDRRELGCLLATVVTGGPLLELVERWLETSPSSTATALCSIGYQELAEIEQAASVFRDWSDQPGARARRRAVIRLLNEVSEILRENHPDGMARRLHSVTAELAKTAATMAWDSGRHGVAQRYYLMAAHSARSAGDRAMFANVVGGGMARQLLYEREPGDALELVRLAVRTAEDHMTPSVRAMLHSREAWAYAELGRITAFERTTGEAEEALVADSADPEPHWIEYFDVAELEATIGGRLLKLARRDVRHVDAAVRRIDRAGRSSRPGRLRGSALNQVGLAEAHMLRGDLDEATHAAHRALDVAAGMDSDRVRLKLGELYRLTVAHRATRSVAELRDRMDPFLVMHDRT